MTLTHTDEPTVAYSTISIFFDILKVVTAHYHSHTILSYELQLPERTALL